MMKPARETFPWDSPFEFIPSRPLDHNTSLLVGEPMLSTRSTVQGIRVARDKTGNQVEQPNAYTL